MISDFSDKVAVITGGAHGIGFAFAQTCIQLGMKVAITASRQASLDQAVVRLDAGERLLAITSDAGDAEANRDLAARVDAAFGAVHLLILNAGISRISPIHELTVEAWQQHINVNLNGPFYGVKAFLPLLERETESHIVITSSIFGLFAAPMQAPYFASKAGLTAFAESLYYDLQAAGSQVGVTMSLPGNTRTNMAEANLSGNEDPELAATIRAELAKGTDPLVVTDAVLKAVSENRFYVFPNTGEFQHCVDARIARLQTGRNPAWEDVGDTV